MYHKGYSSMLCTNDTPISANRKPPAGWWARCRLPLTAHSKPPSTKAVPIMPISASRFKNELWLCVNSTLFS